MSEQPRFENWQPIREALEKAYKELGLEMVQTEPMAWSYPADHWNIAGLVYNQAKKDLAGIGACINCKVVLNYSSVIRCLDCKAPLCERCAPAHFGPNHAGRSAQAHD